MAFHVGRPQGYEEVPSSPEGYVMAIPTQSQDETWRLTQLCCDPPAGDNIPDHVPNKYRC